MSARTKRAASLGPAAGITNQTGNYQNPAGASSEEVLLREFRGREFRGRLTYFAGESRVAYPEIHGTGRRRWRSSPRAAGFPGLCEGPFAGSCLQGRERRLPQVLDHAGQIGRGIGELGSRRYLRTIEGLTMAYLSTRQVARLLGVSASLLTKAVWAGRGDPPKKSPSGSYLWTLSDIERVSQVLAHKSRSSQKRSPNAVVAGADALGRVNMRSKHQVADRLAHRKTVRKKAWVILGCLQDWLWKVSARAMKAFFDALLDHYGGQ